MKRILFAAALSVLASQICSAPALAQMVQVAPGYVRAPFVRVYTDPATGASRVRAPFVDVQNPGFRGRFAEPVPPSPEELSQLDWRMLRMVTRDLANYLDSQLSSLSTGDQWRAHLKTAEIRALVRDESGPPSDQLAEQLRKVVAVFDATEANATFRTVSRLDGFRGLHNALNELLSPPTKRLQRLIFSTARQLDEELAGLGAEAGWQKHLALPEGLIVDPQAPAADSVPDNEAVAKTLARYDAVSKNEQYRSIARLPAFRAMHERLAEYLALSSGQAPREPSLDAPIPSARAPRVRTPGVPTPARPRVEELPEPKPEE